MNKLLKPAYLPWIVTVAGGAGLLLRIWLFASNVDSRGFLVAGHPAEALLWVLTTAVLAVLFLGTRALTQASKYSFNFPASPVGGIGCVIGGFSILFSSIVTLTAKPDGLTVLASIFGLAAAVCLGLIGYGRWYGRRTHFVFHALVSVYFMLHLVSQYRHWCSDPQLLDYCFQLSATVFLMLASYHHAAFAAGSGKRSSYVFFHLSAVYFCLLSIDGSDSSLFYLGMGLWMLTDLCNLTAMPRRNQEES